MLNKEEAKSIETRRTLKGSSYKVYTFECSSCKKDIKSQSNQLSKHSGMCISCSQKGVPYKHIYNELIKNIRSLEFNLTFEQFLELIKVKVCNYCNSEVIFNEHSKDNGKSLSRAYQLDRKDNDEGYVFDNLVVCCWECNRLKSDRFTYEEFMLLSPVLKQIMKSRIIC